jgi:hypothetical protein
MQDLTGQAAHSVLRNRTQSTLRQMRQRKGVQLPIHTQVSYKCH